MNSRESLIKNLSGTFKKLNGKNYLLWAQSFETFIAVHRKLKHLSQPFPDAKDATYEDWYVDDATIVSWLVIAWNLLLLVVLRCFALWRRFGIR